MSSTFGRIREALNRNLMYVVMVPGIGLAQYGWWKLQDDERFVRKEEKREFPAITIYKHMKAFFGLGPPPEKPH